MFRIEPYHGMMAQGLYVDVVVGIPKPGLQLLIGMKKLCWMADHLHIRTYVCTSNLGIRLFGTQTRSTAS